MQERMYSVSIFLPQSVFVLSTLACALWSRAQLIFMFWLFFVVACHPHLRQALLPL